MASITLNTAAFTPIPIASVISAVNANPGDFRNCRIAYLKSPNIVFTLSNYLPLANSLTAYSQQLLS